MSNEAIKKAEVINLNPGDLFLATNGKEYIFVRFSKGIIIGNIDNQGYKIPLKMYRNLVKKGADLDLAQRAAEKEAVIGILKSLGLGDKVLCSDDKVYTFVKLNKAKFIGKIGTETYDIPITMFVDLVDKAKLDPEHEARKARISPYFGQEIQTSWGPAVVKRFSDDETRVILYEFGTERFDLTFDDFYSEIENYGG